MQTENKNFESLYLDAAMGRVDWIFFVLAMFEECKKFGHEETVILTAMKSRGPELNSIKDLIEVIYRIEENGLYESEVSYIFMDLQSFDFA